MQPSKNIDASIFWSNNSGVYEFSPIEAVTVLSLSDIQGGKQRGMMGLEIVDQGHDSGVARGGGLVAGAVTHLHAPDMTTIFSVLPANSHPVAAK
jgi:hypothetical protein